MLRRHWPAWAGLSDIKDLFRLATPVAVSRASMMLMGLTDTIVLSRNAPDELPYVLNAWFPLGICLGASMGLLHGVSVLTAEMAGRKDEANSGRIFRRGLLLSFLLGSLGTLLLMLLSDVIFKSVGFSGALLENTSGVTRILAIGLVGHMLSFAAANYLEALRKPLLVTIVMYSGVVINLVLNLAFVSGWWGFPQMGADGVAIATSGTRWFIAGVLLFIVWRFSPAFWRSAKGPVGEFKRQLEVGYGMAVSSVAEWGAFNFTFIIATWVSIVSGTVYGMVIHSMGFVFMLFLGIGTATSVRVAEGVGAGDLTRIVGSARLGIAVTCLTGGLFTTFLMLFPNIVANIFLEHDAKIGGTNLQPLLMAAIVMAAPVIIFDGLQNVASMACRAMFAVWVPSMIHLGCYIAIMLPMAWYLSGPLNFGIEGVIAGMMGASFLAGSLQWLFLETWMRRRSFQTVTLGKEVGL